MIQVDEKLEILSTQMESILKKDLYINRKVECCPNCESKNYIKYGQYKGIQRFKCKATECGKTFSKTTNSIWSYSKKGAKKWIEFIELMMEKKSLRYCSEKLKINLVTAFYWRHKIMDSITKYIGDAELFNNVQIGKSVMKENFKGCRNIETSKREDIWIVAASGGKDVLVSSPICKRTWNLKSFEEKIYSKVNKNSFIIAHGDRYLQLVANNHNKELEKTEVVFDDRIKYFRRNLNQWIRCFYGIGTKYLKKYLSWFILFYLDRKIDYINLSYDLMKNNTFIKTIDIKRVEENI